MTTKTVITDSEGKDYTEDFLENYHYNEEAESNLLKNIPKDALPNNSSRTHSQRGMNVLIYKIQYHYVN